MEPEKQHRHLHKCLCSQLITQSIVSRGFTSILAINQASVAPYSNSEMLLSNFLFFTILHLNYYQNI